MLVGYNYINYILYEIRIVIWVQDKKTLLVFKIRSLFWYDIRKILSAVGY